jgi:hypothetical protein
MPVAISSFAVWTSAGVWTNSAPDASAAGAGLAPWPSAPSLAQVHPGARRPHAQAVALVQLSHLLLSTRAQMAGPFATTPPRQELDLLLGTETGCSTADLDFLDGLQRRGPGFGSPSVFVYTLATSAPAEVSLALGLRGAVATLTAGGVSGVASVARAAARISAGRSRACICGGMEYSSSGPRRASGQCAQDIVALFLLEAAPERTSSPTLLQWGVGFAPQSPPSTPTPLLSLAMAVARAATSSAPEALACSSPDGHWARLTIGPPAPVGP